MMKVNLKKTRGLVASWLIVVSSVYCAEGQSFLEEDYLFTPAGFTRPGQPVWAAEPMAAQLTIVVRDDASGEMTPCRINVVGPDGNFYQPPKNRLSPFALTGSWPRPGSWGNRLGKAPYRYIGRFFYTTGETTVPVPAGSARVEVWKGLEYRPETVTVELKSGVSTRLEVRLVRRAPMDAEGYYAGDTHLHLPRQSPEDDRVLFDLLAAEGMQYGGVLAYNDPPGPYTGSMDTLEFPQRFGLGRSSIRVRSGIHLVSGQEYRSGTYGHLNLFLRDELVAPGQQLNANNWPLYGDVGRETIAAGGFAVPAHGGYGQAIYADAALGTINAVELLQFGVYRGIGLEGWYDMLNTGYRFPAQGASDYPPCRTMADCRTYVYHATAPSMEEWLAGIAAGRSFFTTGPLLLFEVDGQKPGAQIHKSGPDPQSVKVRLRVRSEVTPVTDIELVVNGRVWEHIPVAPSERQGAWVEVERTITLSGSSWVAARAYSQSPAKQPDAEAHTNPIYVYFQQRAPYQQASLDAWIARIDQQIAIHTARTFPEKAKVLNYFQQARDVLLKIRSRGGLTSEDNPATWSAGSAMLEPGVRNLAADGSVADPTERELQTFLRPVPPRSPEEAIKTFETIQGFHMELVAAEPLVNSPITAAFDEDGNLYVGQMTDYPYNTDQPVRVAWQKLEPPGTRPLGSVRLLRDTDGDGRFDESHLFADGLLWVGGIVPWQGGVFVASPPDIWYLKDTDGDFKADVRVKVFTGFGIQNQQGGVNSLQFALDHLIYGNTSVNGGEVSRVGDASGEPLSLRNRDFRFDPRSYRLEPTTGTRQFGLAFDDWGNRFLCNQSEPAFHVVLPLQYLERNPHFTPAATIFKTHPSPTPTYRISPVEAWRHIRSTRRVAERVRPADSAGVSHHVIDAGAGVTIFRGGAYPQEYYGNLFVGDGQNNIVHRRIVVPHGATYRTERADENTEFVRSSDIWFRPVNFLNAPDGTLYCLDMYREYLETINIPADVERHLDMTSGRDRGRIYRIAPDGFRSPAPPRLSQASADELVKALESPHGWWRDTAHRLLFERQDRSVIPSLERLARQSRSPQARVHALWTLRGLEALRPNIIAAGLGDEHPDVRENAVRLAEAHLDASPELRGRVKALAGDAAPRVRLQVAFNVGQSTQWDQAALLTQLAHENMEDPWIQAAVLSSAAACAGDLLDKLVSDGRLIKNPRGLDFLRQLLIVVGAQKRVGDVSRAVRAVAQVRDAEAALRLASALGEGLKRAGASLAEVDRENRLADLFQQARELALDANGPESRRLAAVAVLELVTYEQASSSLLGLLQPNIPAALQLAAIAALERFGDTRIGPELLERYPHLQAPVQRRVVDALLAREERVAELLAALESGRLNLTELSASQTGRLRRISEPGLRERVQRLLGAEGSVGRQHVYQAYLPALTLTGVRSRGKELAESRCFLCHQFSGLGQEFGPDLTGIASGGKEKFLSSLLEPNRDVSPQYYIVKVETADGESFAGILKNDTATTVTLLQPGGEARTIPRNRIASMSTDQQSFMPEGLETGWTPQDVADLIEYLFNPHS